MLSDVTRHFPPSSDSSFCPSRQVSFHSKSVRDNKWLTETCLLSSQRTDSSKREALPLQASYCRTHSICYGRWTWNPKVVGKSLGRANGRGVLADTKCAISPLQDTATHYLRDRLLLASWIEALGEKLQVPPLTKRNPLLPKCLLIISSIQDLTLKSFCHSQDPPNMSFIPSHKFVRQDITRPSTECAQRYEGGGLWGLL